MLMKLYKTYLERLLIGMLLLIELERTDGKAVVIAKVHGWTSNNHLYQDAVDRALGAYAQELPGEDASNAEVLAGTFGQLTKKRSDDADLLDTVVRLVQLPYVNNYISARTLLDLRDAILTPSEQKSVKTALKDSIQCAQCRRDLTSGEMVSIHTDKNMPCVICHKCQRPQYVACDHCEKPMIISGKVTGTHMKGVDCGCRTKAPTDEPPLITRDQLRRLGATPGRNPVYPPGATQTATMEELRRIYVGGVREAAPFVMTTADVLLVDDLIDENPV